MAPKADKKAKGKKTEDPPVVRTYENKETQTEPPKSALKYLCCRKRDSNPKPAASDSTSIIQRICTWLPCFCFCDKGKSAELEKPCLCVRNCSDGELAKSIRQLKKKVVQSGQYPLTEAVLSQESHEPPSEIKGEAKSKKKEEKKPPPENEKEKSALQCLTQHHKANCPCADHAVWCEFLRPPRPRKRCRYCHKPL